MRVLIIGGGPAGILMAQVSNRVCLLESKIPATVFEQAPSPTARPHDWNFGIYWAQSRLEECLSPDIMDALHAVQTDVNNKPSADAVLPIFDGITGELMSPIGAPFAARGVDVVYGKRIQRIEEDEGGQVTVTFADGTRETGDLVVGAEGAHSVVREFLYRESPEDGALLTTPIVASATVGTMDREVAVACRERSSLCHITLDRNGLFTFVSTHDVSAPDPADWVFVIVMSWPSEEDLGLETYDEIHKDMVSRVQDLTHPFKEAITTFKPFEDRCWHARMTYWPTKPWDSLGGRVTLAGDAAHAMTFHRGQGLGNAITDAAEMLQHLGAMTEQTPAELAKAVQAYETGMWPRGLEAVTGNLENTMAIHNWEVVMQSPLVVKGLKKEGDKVRVNRSDIDEE